ncbi:hypothetical protein NC651_023289 [Populus alba x Populus x berolinensis]|nr:hypothetical protein NC651_023289 [Populus alba x Populus x berolinensis]
MSVVWPRLNQYQISYGHLLCPSSSSFLASHPFRLVLSCFDCLLACIVLFVCFPVKCPSPGAGFGINYGQIADNLPSPSSVSVMLQPLDVSRLKLYDANPKVLQAFSNSSVEFIVGIGNG